MSTSDILNPISLDEISLWNNDIVQQETLPDSIACHTQEDELNEVPMVGMIFETTDKVKEFYKQYAIRCGFGVRVRSSSKGEDNELCFVKLVCSREGNYVSTIPPELKSQPTKIKNCGARITAVKKGGQWHIKNVILDHNHDLSSMKSRIIRGNKKLNMQVKQTLDMNDEAGVRINKSFQSLVCDVGGFENLPFVERDVRNYIG
ncbi:protein FAR1-RELATED SEQUENCE 7-like [Vigna unguiculata]|uniref:protein FAR1-RELATED SEQUENCE 7-like n=1 Tax=Vigna unguiculata TaxID=3917 RepID=UPI001016F744|nr:protein FAR1-RELATED SEQUENCE 7-like [Vigna unguiculata]